MWLKSPGAAPSQWGARKGRIFESDHETLLFGISFCPSWLECFFVLAAAAQSRKGKNWLKKRPAGRVDS